MSDKESARVPYRKCEFCRCFTNARVRRCCNAGTESDTEASKRRAVAAMAKEPK